MGMAIYPQIVAQPTFMIKTARPADGERLDPVLGPPSPGAKQQ
ncbi:hypothetical protein OHA77_33810 [Streptosporangium sp. NBC_01639]|nr:hypothetical protein OHA77_33810 [Streptosporangium sp. NBC_01639]